MTALGAVVYGGFFLLAALVVGCVMETTAALILLVPVLAALTPQMGVDPVQFGVLMVVNLATPVGRLSSKSWRCAAISAVERALR